MIFAVQEPVEADTVKQETPSSRSINQEGPSAHAIAAGAASVNKVIVFKHTAIFVAHSLTSLPIAGSPPVLQCASVCCREAFQTK